MPIYEYQCDRCQGVFELLRDRSERDRAATCPSCGCVKSQRRMSTFAGRVGSGSGESSSVAGSGGCTSCTATSCTGCRR